VAARYGRAGGACDALASGLLAEQAARLAERWPRCRVLHLDWAPWAEPDQPGRRPATPRRGQAAPIPVEDGSRYLLSLLTTADLPARAAVHGRLGVPAPAALAPGLAGTAARGRFGETVRVHYPGVELIADTRLSVQADPYLADYRIDDLPMLPAAMVLEAMAQTASALAGRELRHLADVRLTAPVLLLGRAGHEGAVIRVCALRAGDTVEAVLRCAETGFRLDHARAVFRTAGRHGAQPPPAGWAAGPGRGTGSVAPGAMVDGTDLYGQLFFQTGRFRRVAFLPEASSRACRALVRGGDDLPWFGAVPGPVDAPLMLGSPGLNDAALHVLQACLPHRRVLATGCESVTFSGREVRGALRVQAVRRPPAAGDPIWVWDVVATDATGQPVVTWQGVRLRDVGALVPPGPWHPALLAISVEARAAEFGLDPELRAMISCGAPPPGREAAAGAGPETAGDDQPWSDRAEGTGPLAGFELTVRASRPVACRWQAVGGLTGDIAPLDEALVAVRGQLAARLREPAAALDARLATIASVLTALGRVPGTPLRAEDASDAGWIVVRARDMAVASAVTRLSGVGAPVAVALASLLTRPGPAGPGLGGRDERLTAGGR
jgi:enediyne polyketide synthase